MRLQQGNESDEGDVKSAPSQSAFDVLLFALPFGLIPAASLLGLETFGIALVVEFLGVALALVGEMLALVASTVSLLWALIGTTGKSRSCEHLQIN